VLRRDVERELLASRGQRGVSVVDDKSPDGARGRIAGESEDGAAVDGLLERAYKNGRAPKEQVAFRVSCDVQPETMGLGPAPKPCLEYLVLLDTQPRPRPVPRLAKMSRGSM
jgi:hypothetical protein